VFNRDPQHPQTIPLDSARLGLPRQTKFDVIWGQPELLADDVLFARYESASR
jgi:hypothetical protein